MKKKYGSRLFYVFLAVVLVVSALACGATYYVFYKYYKASEAEYINERLMVQASDWNYVLNYNLVEVNDQEQRARKSANEIVIAQLKPIQTLIQKTIDEGGTSSELIIKDLLDRLASQTVGKAGYIWIVDSQGKYILSKDRLRDGENIMETKDARGNYLVKDVIARALSLSPGAIDVNTFFWQYPGEKKARERISSFTYFKELDWLVGASLYYDELIDVDARNKSLEALKGVIAAQKIGRSGYIWIVDSNGTYVVSKNRLRDGENILDQKDYDGNYFIRVMIKKAKAANGAAVDHTYSFKNSGEKSARSKMAGLVYNKDLDWIIGVSSYYDDLDTTEVTAILPTLIILMFGLALLSFLFIRYYVIKKTASITILANDSRRVAAGEVVTALSDIESGDELGEIKNAMAILIEKSGGRRK